MNEERLESLLRGWPDGERERETARIVRELRRETPAAPEALRERVRALGVTEPAAPSAAPSRLDPVRRALPVLAAALLVAAVGPVVVGGIVSATQGTREEEAAEAPAEQFESAPAGGEDRGAPEAAPAEPAPEAATEAIPPTPGRVQDYRAYLRLHVGDGEDLSRATNDVLRLTRGFRGYVVSVDYRAEREGEAVLDLRIPIRRIQDAVLRFSALGTILEQQVSIRDLEVQVDRSAQRLRRLERRIADLRAELRDPSLSEEERARLEARVASARAKLAALRAHRARLLREGRFADVSLALTTVNPLAGRDEPGRIERAFDGALSVFVKEIALAVYLAIVVAPLALLAALAFAGVRAARRRADERVLEGG